MASKYSRAAQKSKKDASMETSESIDQQVQNFLQSGGKIQYINSGVSGQQDNKGPKHITLGKTPSR